VSIPTANLPLAVKVIDQAYCSLFDLSGGRRWYVLNAAVGNVRIYLPVPTAGTRLIFVRADSGASGRTARVYAKTDATLNGSATAYIDLILAGDAMEVIADSNLAGWMTPDRCSTLYW
jgi:hypothetical protein